MAPLKYYLQEYKIKTLIHNLEDDVDCEELQDQVCRTCQTNNSVMISIFSFSPLRCKWK